MVRKRYNDKDEIVELQREVEELKKQLAKLPKKGIESLSIREKRVYEFIENHPGTNKQKIIKKLTDEGVGSRMTIIKAINNLEEYAAIKRAPKEKPNTQVYELYINQDSTFWSVYRELNSFKNVFFDLVKNIIDRSSQEKKRSEDRDLLYHLLLISNHVLGVYLSYFMLKWQKEIHEPLILNKLHAMVIYSMIEIQTKLSDAFKVSDTMPDFHYATNAQVSSPIPKKLIRRMFLLEPHTMLKILQDYRKHGLHREIAPVLAIAWEIGFPIYPYLNLNMYSPPRNKDVLKNWNHAMGYYLIKNKVKADEEIWEIVGPPVKS